RDPRYRRSGPARERELGLARCGLPGARAEALPRDVVARRQGRGGDTRVRPRDSIVRVRWLCSAGGAGVDRLDRLEPGPRGDRLRGGLSDDVWLSSPRQAVAPGNSAFRGADRL